MKKLMNSLILVGLIALSSCGTETATNTENANAAEIVVENQTEVKSAQAKVIQMNNEMFKAQVADYEANPQTWIFKGDKPCIVDFYATWCAPCKRIAPILDELAKEYDGKIDIYKIDTDKEKQLASVFGIQSIPSILFVPASGNPQMYQGAFPKEQYVKLINDVLKVK